MSFVNTSDSIGISGVLDGLIDHTLTALADDSVMTLGKYAFYKNNAIQSVDLPTLATVNQNAFEDCTALTTATFGALKTLGQYMFKGCTSLTTLELPEVTTTAQYAFQNCTALQSLSLPKATALQGYMFSGCTGMTTLNAPLVTRLENYALDNSPAFTFDFSNITYVGSYAFNNCPRDVVALPACTSISTYLGSNNGPKGFDFTQKLTIPASAFMNSSNMTHLILRSSELCPLSNANAFTGTPIGAGFGYIYVPTDLVDTYKAASNWSTYASQIVAISEYPKMASGSITDSWQEILEACGNGTYASKYNVGDTKIVEIDGNAVGFRIIAKDTDPLSSGTGNAPLTWLSMGILETRAMNATQKTVGGQTQWTAGGWAETDMREYIRETLLPKFPEIVRLNIKEVNKTYRVKSPSDTTETIADTLWIPSYKEVGFTNASYVESSGVVYSDVFTNNTTRVIKQGNLGLGSAYSWWLRSACNAYNFSMVRSNGSESNDNANYAYGLVLGFCT